MYYVYSRKETTKSNVIRWNKMLKEIERQILETVINRLKLGDKIAATRIIETQAEYQWDGNYTMCRLFSTTKEEGVIAEGVGFSKRNPRDRFIVDVGSMIAFSRAAKNYVRTLAGLNEIKACIKVRI